MRAWLVSTKGLFLKQGSYISVLQTVGLILSEILGLFVQIEMGNSSN